MLQHAEFPLSPSAVRVAFLSLAIALSPVALPAPAQGVSTEPTQVSSLTITRAGWARRSSENSGPGFWFFATDPEGLKRIVGRWCSEEVPGYCLTPTWTPQSPGQYTPTGVLVMVDVPADAPLGTYMFQEITFTDMSDNTTTFLPGGQTLINGEPGAPHSFRLDGGMDVVDESAPTMTDLHWANDRNWAVVGGDDEVAMDIEVQDDWRKPVYVRVHLEAPGEAPYVNLDGTLPEIQSGSQTGWVHATGELGDMARTSADYEVTRVDVADAQGNTSYYYPDGKLVTALWAQPPVATQHQLDLTALQLEVRDEVPSLKSAAPIADSTLRYDWSPAIDADGAAPDNYTIRLIPYQPTGLDVPYWSPLFWEPSDLPARTFTVPGSETTLTVDDLENGRRYDIELRAHFGDRTITGEASWAAPEPRIYYSPAVEVVEGDQGVSPAVVTARLSSPSIVDTYQSLYTQPITARDGEDFDKPLDETLAIPAGSTSATVRLNILGDTRDEEDETLEHLTYALAENSQTTIITILDDDPMPGGPLAIGSTQVPGTGVGQAPAVLTVRLAHAHRAAVTVEYKTINKSAIAGLDYRATNGTLRFKPGVVSRTISIPVYATNSPDDAEFLVRLWHQQGAAITRNTGHVIIQRSATRVGSKN